MDITNPGSVSVSDEAYPAPLPEVAIPLPPNLDDLELVDGQSRPAGVTSQATTFPTPTNVDVGLQPLLSAPGVTSAVVPAAPNVNPATQNLTAGTWQEFTVVGGPEPNVQTNTTDVTDVEFTVTSVVDADTLAAPTVSTTRYRLGILPAPSSFPISLTGRDLEFADDTLTAADASAVRTLTASQSAVVIDKADATDLGCPILTDPQVGDTVFIDTSRSGSQPIVDVGGAPTNVFVPSPALVQPTTLASTSAGLTENDVQDQALGVPPPISGSPSATSEDLQTATNTTSVSDQTFAVGLPLNINI